jgi:Amt family ammonium transporter
LKPRCRYDDSLDAFGVHGAAGIAGAALTGLFASEAVGGAPGSLEQAAIQLAAVGVTALYSALATAGILWLLRKTMGLRVSDEVEREGLDYALHGESLG